MVRGGGGHACQILECWFFICGHFRCERSWRKAVHIFDVIHHLGIKFRGFRCFNKRAFQLILSNAFPRPKNKYGILMAHVCQVLRDLENLWTLPKGLEMNLAHHSCKPRVRWVKIFQEMPERSEVTKSRLSPCEASRKALEILRRALRCNPAGPKNLQLTGQP